MKESRQEVQIEADFATNSYLKSEHDTSSLSLLSRRSRDKRCRLWLTLSQTHISREDPSKKRQTSPVEVYLPVGDVLLPSQALVEIAAPGSAASRSCLPPGNKRAGETQSILSVTTELLGLLLAP